jgi:DNA-binding protein HU-beta
MNKQQLGDKIAEQFNLPKIQGEDIVKFVVKTMTEELKAGNEVVLTGFGTFSTRLRAARKGVNPQSPKEKIDVPAVTIPKFKSGKSLKDALKGK